MKKFTTISLLLALFALFTAAIPQNSPKVGVVNFKECIEKSQLGKSEQARFEQMRKELEAEKDKKEKELNSMAPKFSDEYLDTLTPEAEAKLKNEFKNLNQELALLEDKYYKVLNETNYEILHNLTESVSKACEKLAKAKGLDMAINSDVCFYRAESLDMTKEVIAEMDAQTQTQAKK